MAKHILSTRHLAEALHAEGFPLPNECAAARLIMGVNQAFLIQYDVFLTEETLAQLGRALQRIAGDSWRQRQHAPS